MTIAQALIKGTADATAAQGDIATGKTAYVNGQKITGNAVIPQVESITKTSSIDITFKYVPSIVILFITKYTGEMITQCVQKFRTGTNAWSDVGRVSSIHNYYDGSGGSNFGSIVSINDNGCRIEQMQSAYQYYLIALP